MIFSEKEIKTYDRQIRLAEFGGAGQQKLKSSSVFVFGAGGLGCPIVTYLAMAGVGDIRIVDPDTIQESNLNRQFFKRSDISCPKAEKLAGFAIDISLSNVTYDVREDMPWVWSLARPNLVIDATDNYTARMQINERCVESNIPLLSASVSAWGGQISLYTGSPCYACWASSHENEPCGVLGAMAGIVGTMAALEAIKFLSGIETITHNRLLTINGLTMETQVINIPVDERCIICR